MAEKLNNKAIFDGRNMFSMEQVEDTGFYYKSIGRKPYDKKNYQFLR